MPRKTPVRELSADESSQPASPLRRSTRIASPGPAKLIQRRSSASSDTPAKISRAKRLSLSQDLSESTENKPEAKDSESDAVTLRRSTRSTHSSSKSPPPSTRDNEVKTTSTRTRPRRGSVSKIIEEEEALESDDIESSDVKLLKNDTSTPNTANKSESSRVKTRRASAAEKITPLKIIDESPKTEPKRRTVRDRKTSSSSSVSLQSIEESNIFKERANEDASIPAKINVAVSAETEDKKETSEKETLREENLKCIVEDETKKVESVETYGLPVKPEFEQTLETKPIPKTPEKEHNNKEKLTADKSPVAKPKSPQSTDKQGSKSSCRLSPVVIMHSIEKNLNSIEEITTPKKEGMKHFTQKSPVVVLQSIETILSSSDKKEDANVDVKSKTINGPDTAASENEKVENKTSAEEESKAINGSNIAASENKKGENKTYAEEERKAINEPDTAASKNEKFEKKTYAEEERKAINGPNTAASENENGENKTYAEEERKAINGPNTAASENGKGENKTYAEEEHEAINGPDTASENEKVENKTDAEEEKHPSLINGGKEKLGDEQSKRTSLIELKENLKNVKEIFSAVKKADSLGPGTLLTHELDMTLGSDGSFHLNLSLNNTESGSQEDIVEHCKANASKIEETENVDNISSTSENSHRQNKNKSQLQKSADANNSAVEDLPLEKKKHLMSEEDNALTDNNITDVQKTSQVLIETVQINKTEKYVANESPKTVADSFYEPMEIEYNDISITQDETDEAAVTDVVMKEHICNDLSGGKDCLSDRIESDVEPEENQAQGASSSRRDEAKDLEEKLDAAAPEDSETIAREVLDRSVEIKELVKKIGVSESATPELVQSVIEVDRNLQQNTFVDDQNDNENPPVKLISFSKARQENQELQNSNENKPSADANSEQIPSQGIRHEKSPVMQLESDCLNDGGDMKETNLAHVERSVSLKSNLNGEELPLTENKETVNSKIPDDEEGNSKCEDIVRTIRKSVSPAFSSDEELLAKEDQTTVDFNISETPNISRSNQTFTKVDNKGSRNEEHKSEQNGTDIVGNELNGEVDKEIGRSPSPAFSVDEAPCEQEANITIKENATDEIKNVNMTKKNLTESDSQANHKQNVNKQSPDTKLKENKVSSDLDAKLDDLIEKGKPLKDSSDEYEYEELDDSIEKGKPLKDSSDEYEYEEYNNVFIDNMAEEGEEDTPSEGSNDIPCEGESINSKDTTIDSDDSYERDSFIDDEEEGNLLSGEEDFLQSILSVGKGKKVISEKDAVIGEQTKYKKKSRIISISESDDEQMKDNLVGMNSETETPIVEDKLQIESNNSVKAANDKILESENYDSDDKMSTEPYLGLTPPSQPSVQETSSDIDERSMNNENEIMINDKDNLKSLEELKQKSVVSTKPVCGSKTENVICLDTDEDDASQSVSHNKLESPTEIINKSQMSQEVNTPNNSITSSAQRHKSKNKSSINIQENIKLENIQQGDLSERITRVVDLFYSSIIQNDISGNVSVNVSIDYEDGTSNDSDMQEKKSDGMNEKVVLNLSTDKKSSGMEEEAVLNLSTNSISTKSPQKYSSSPLVSVSELKPSQKMLKESDYGQNNNSIEPTVNLSSKKKLKSNRRESIAFEEEEAFEVLNIDSESPGIGFNVISESSLKKKIHRSDNSSQSVRGDQKHSLLRDKGKSRKLSGNEDSKKMKTETEHFLNIESVEKNKSRKHKLVTTDEHEIQVHYKTQKHDDDDQGRNREKKIKKAKRKKSKHEANNDASDICAEKIKETGQLIETNKSNIVADDDYVFKKKKSKTSSTVDQISYVKQKTAESEFEESKEKEILGASVNMDHKQGVKKKSKKLLGVVKQVAESDIMTDTAKMDVSKKKKKKHKNISGVANETVDLSSENLTVFKNPIPKENLTDRNADMDLIGSVSELSNKDVSESKLEKRSKKPITEEHHSVFKEPVSLKRSKKQSKENANDFIPSSNDVIKWDMKRKPISYFPSDMLEEITSNETVSTAEVPKITDENKKRKRKKSKPVLMPSTGMDLCSWNCEPIKTAIFPSATSKSDIYLHSDAGTSKPSKKRMVDKVSDTFQVDDFKNKMLYDSSRVKRMATKTLLSRKLKNM